MSSRTSRIKDIQGKSDKPKGDSSISMEDLVEKPPKRSRTSGKHSRNGCGTCKIRRVKCDETRPICHRCRNFKIPCDGYDRVPRNSSQTNLTGGLLIAPKPKTPSIVTSIPPTPSILVVENAEDYQYFAFFRDQLLIEITQFAHADDFRTIILQASNIPSIRHTMIALAALGKTHSVIQDATSNDVSALETTEAVTHREYSIRQYSKGLALMKQAIASGNQDLRTTLLTCLLIICIECLHGNFEMAGTQVFNGMALLRDWRKNYPNADLHPIGFSSPAPDVIEDSLVQMLGGLEFQSYYSNGKTSQEKQERGKEEGHAIVRNMPTRFQSLDESRLYLELLLRRSKHWFFSMEHLFQPLTPKHDPEHVYTPWLPFLDNTSSNTSGAALYPATVRHLNSLPKNFSDLALNSETFKAGQDRHISDLSRWKASFDAMLCALSEKETPPRWKEQLLAYKVCTLVLKTIITGDEMIFDSYTPEMVEILDLAESVLEFQTSSQRQSSNTTFSIFQRSTGPPHFVGLHCRVGAVRRRAIRFLGSLPNAPALSDSALMKAIVEWVMELEEAEMVDGSIPAYARIRNVGVEVDAGKKRSTLVCTHGVLTGEGEIEEMERRKVVDC